MAAAKTGKQLRNTKPWNQMMDVVNADETVYVDYKDAAKSTPVCAKLKTSVEKISQWIDAHKQFYNATYLTTNNLQMIWENDAKNNTMRLKKKSRCHLIVKFHITTGVILAQGCLFSKWAASDCHSMKQLIQSATNMDDVIDPKTCDSNYGTESVPHDVVRDKSQPSDSVIHSTQDVSNRNDFACQTQLPTDLTTETETSDLKSHIEMCFNNLKVELTNQITKGSHGDTSSLQAELKGVKEQLMSMEATIKQHENTISQQQDLIMNLCESVPRKNTCSSNEQIYLKNENSQLKNKIKSMASEHEKLTKLITTLSDQSQDKYHSAEVSYASIATKNFFTPLLTLSDSHDDCRSDSDTNGSPEDHSQWSEVRHRRKSLQSRQAKPGVSSAKCSHLPSQPSTSQRIEMRVTQREQSTEEPSPHKTSTTDVPSENCASGVPSNVIQQSFDVKTGVTVIGSSRVRGLGNLLNDTKLNAVCYTNPGCKAQHITDRVPNMLCGLKNDYVILAGGANNIPDESVKSCVQNIGLLVATTLAHNERCHVILPNIPYRYDEPMLNSKIDEVNNVLKQKCNGMARVTYLHQMYESTDYKRDGLHFNRVGQAKLASALRQAVFSHSASSAREG